MPVIYGGNMHEVADSRVLLQCDSGSVDLESIARQLNPAWLTQALAQRSSTVLVQRVKIVRVVAGCSIKVWVELRYANGRDGGLPRVMIVKAGFGRHDPIMLFTYEIEMQTYRDVLTRFQINAPACHYAGASPDGRSAAVIIEDLLPKKVRFCQALSPLRRNEAESFLGALARFHAQTWNHPCLTDGSWAWTRTSAETGAGLRSYFESLMEPRSWARFMELPRGSAVPKLLHDHGRLVDGFARLGQFGQTQPRVILVGDEHLGNLYIEADGRPGFLDFQARIAPWCQGIAYFMGAGLDIADRRKWERGLLEHYLEQLAASGIEPPAMTEAWDAYCRQLLFGFFVWATNGSHFQTESVNTANTARFALAMIDNDTLGRLGVHRE
jgi:hypothetical protein